MERFVIEGSKSSPFVCFDPQKHILEIKGDSYPENAAGFYSPIFSWLKGYLCQVPPDTPIQMDLDVPYFNSSSSKVFLNLFDLLEQSATEGKKVVVRWHYDKENETAWECGLDFKEETGAVELKLVEKGA